MAIVLFCLRAVSAFVNLWITMLASAKYCQLLRMKCLVFRQQCLWSPPGSELQYCLEWQSARAYKLTSHSNHSRSHGNYVRFITYDLNDAHLHPQPNWCQT